MTRRALALACALSLGCARVTGLLRAAGRNVAAMVSPARRVAGCVRDPVRRDARLSVLWVGHATTLLQLDDRLVLTDPIFTPSAGQISWRVVEPGLALDDVPRVDVTLISHMHFDHLSPATLRALGPRVGHLIAPAYGLPYIPDGDFTASDLDTWERWEDRGLRVTAVPVQHRGARYGEDEAWMADAFTGYVVEYRGLTVYFGGDTGYAPARFAEAARRFPRIDLALLPIGPITPRRFVARWHMDPDEALRALDDLGAARMVPIHFDTFVNSDDAPGEDLAALRAAMRARGTPEGRVVVLGVGEQRVLIPGTPPGAP